jgi:hypothetical protein
MYFYDMERAIDLLWLIPVSKEYVYIRLTHFSSSTVVIIVINIITTVETIITSSGSCYYSQQLIKYRSY